MAATIRVLGKDHLTGSTLTVGDSDDKVTVHFPGRDLAASRRDLFYAWLGTENGASATWLIRDHGPRLGIGGISHIVVNSVQNITIYFTE
ncbi:hypothetical protein [Nocardia sp. NRRL S-836]|uniref:hypothetical protein n=1 Tax=Nocardia sp. NRRL S-836 TaxID=1519492 RepID=UPI0006B0572C|nr:hypothetical protein [Nocardia sp. NRRL S-836]KOV84708.1 hypothetical protein ADL03_15665 [Nocardia sp. NRRL S-836]